MSPGEAPVSHCEPDAPVALEAGQVTPLEIFAERRFYQQRAEPEEVFVGELLSAPVREGPNTREMPLKLVVGDEVFGVYVSGYDLDLLRPYVGRKVEVVGKRIDQRNDGYGIEIWMATIRLC
jgi:hypothetical protein